MQPMSRFSVFALSLLVALFLVKPGQAADSVDLEAAKAQFLKSCGTCHTVEKGAPTRQGPNLATAIGRKAGSLAEFPRYSDALKTAGVGGLTWDADKLDQWITNPSKLVPGATMPYRQADPDKRKLVIDYLKSLVQ